MTEDCRWDIIENEAMRQAEQKDGVPVCEDKDVSPWIRLSDHSLGSDGLLYHLISFLQTRSLKTNSK